VRRIEIVFGIALTLLGIGFSVSGIQSLTTAAVFWSAGLMLLAFAAREPIRSFIKRKTRGKYQTFMSGGQVRYRCPKCEFDTYDKSLLDEHIRWTHSNAGR
jgi:hypothetical protein